MGWEATKNSYGGLNSIINHLAVKDEAFYYIGISTGLPMQTEAPGTSDRNFILGRFDMENRVVTQCQDRADQSRIDELLLIEDLTANFIDPSVYTTPSYSYSFPTSTGDSFVFLTQTQ